MKNYQYEYTRTFIDQMRDLTNALVSNNYSINITHHNSKLHKSPIEIKAELIALERVTGDIDVVIYSTRKKIGFIRVSNNGDNDQAIVDWSRVDRIEKIVNTITCNYLF